jgi:DNA (cytosine-5)-methyltransferase 1
MGKCQLKAIDLFSGIGGLSLGAARAGLEVVVAVDTDKNASAAHMRNFPSVVHLEQDVFEITAEVLLKSAGILSGKEVAIIGGPPCQGFSLIGHRNVDDPRNHLFVRFFEIVQKLQPAFFLAENVPGIMEPENDQLREAALTLVRNDYRLLPPIKVAAHEFGAPTSRLRYFFIGYKDNHFGNLSELAFAGGHRRVFIREALSGLPKRIHPNAQSEIKSWRKVTYPKSINEYWRAIRGQIPSGIGDPLAIKRLNENQLVSGFLGTAHAEAIMERFSKVKQGEQDKISKARRLKWDGFCPTLRAGTGSDRGSYQAVRPIHPSENRVITPREAARLQGFPDWFQFSPTKWHSFRQIGNSVSPILAEAVIKKILEKRR